MNIQQPANGKSLFSSPHCPRCNTRLQATSMFCSFCGRNLKDQQVKPQNMNAPSAVSSTSQQPTVAHILASNLLWPIIIILSAIAAGLVSFMSADTAIRPLITFWFLCVCPGMSLVHFLHLEDAVAEWVLAIASSLAIDASVAMLQLYTGLWSPEGTLSILVSISVIATIVQLIMKRYCGY